MPFPADLIQGAQAQQNADEFSPFIDSLKKEWPSLRDHDFYISRGKPREEGGTYSEFYPPWERDNPSGVNGMPHIEIYDQKFQGQDLRELIAGEMLHYLGSIDPRTQTAVDPHFRTLKQIFTQSLTPQQWAFERNRYTDLLQSKSPEAVNGDGEIRPFEDYLDMRSDAYIRGGLLPAINPEWQAPGVYTDEQELIFLEMQKSLMTPRKKKKMSEYSL